MIKHAQDQASYLEKSMSITNFLHANASSLHLIGPLSMNNMPNSSELYRQASDG